ncbi:MAG: hypothetical protein MUP76_10850 [Acidimicrobiia bacterium]|nr:hypothetical protein [Acidimicrobiia bacterium]
MGLIALLDGLLSGFSDIVIALAQPGQWILPLTGIGLLLQVLPRSLVAIEPTPARGPWRVRWAGILFTLLAGVFFSAGWIALFNSMFSASLYTSFGNLVFYWCLATVAGGLAAVAWMAVGLYQPRDWESWIELGGPGPDDVPSGSFQ